MYQEMHLTRKLVNRAVIHYITRSYLILTLVPTPMSPPGTAYMRSFCSAKRDTILL